MPYTEEQLAAAALKGEGSDEYPSQDDLEAFRAFVGLVKSDILPARDAFTVFGLPAGYGYFVRAFECFERARAQAGLRFFADLQLRLAAGTRAPEILRAMLATPTLWLPGQVIAELAEVIARSPPRARDLLVDQAAKTRKAYQAGKIRERAELFGEAPGWGDLPAADALRLYAARTELAAAFARSASADAASEKEIAFQTLRGWAVHTPAARAVVRQRGGPVIPPGPQARPEKVRG